MAPRDTQGTINWSTAIERLRAGAQRVREYVADTDLLESARKLNKEHVPLGAQDEVDWFINMLDGMAGAITNDTTDVPVVPEPTPVTPPSTI